MTHPIRSVLRGNPVKLKSWIAPLLTAAGVAFYISYMCSFAIAIEAKVNGVFYGYVDSLDLFGDQKRAIENAVSESLGSDYTFDCDITYSFTLTKDPVYLTDSECADILQALADDVYTEAYMLYVDDTRAAANEDYDGLSSLIEQIESDLLASGGDDFSRVEISNRLRIEKQLCPIDSLKSLDEINELLNPIYTETMLASVANASYEADEDSGYVTLRVSAFSAAAPASTETTELMDPNIDYGVLRQPDASTSEEDLTLSYTLIRSETLDEVVRYETTYLDDYDNFIGTDTVTSEGSDGMRRVTYEISCDGNGNELSRTVVSETTLVPVVDRVVMVGAAEIPAAESTGTFIWPSVVEKGISSYYGGRDLNGAYDFHLGIDIPNVDGTEIYAADGGEIIWAGFTPSYGYSVRIQHKNSLITLYAHLSKMFVSVGDMVYQGQEIGLMGHTGAAYGTHLHFEVRIGSVTVNPMKYLPELAD